MRHFGGAPGACAAISAAWLAACAFPAYAPTDIKPGDPREAVLRLMGPPSADFPLPDGRERLEYNHMPAGRQTFMIDLDAAGRVTRWENVLDEAHFAAIREGMTPDDVRRLIGPPSDTGLYHRPEPGITWRYRYEAVPRCTLFEVAFDRASGRVVSTEYPPDPACPGEWR